MRATTPDAVLVTFGVLDALGVAEAVAVAVAVVVGRTLGDVVALGLGAVVRAVRRGAVAFGLGAVVFVALGEALGVLVALGEALGAVALAEALGAADAVDEGSPAWPAFQGRPQFASVHQAFLFHTSFVVLFSALLDRCPPPAGQLEQAMAADGMPTVPTATAAITIRR
ncbi:hypothetical protein [Streptomyces sp. NPDC048277]|uniref:hypothetical protein n=1 Tax=Streptomyces sp. NPDC048277 TaxID=3155027 RepID=UPI0033CDC5D1